MSDNSTGATDNGIDTVEPSMEDILASIRRIIADDEVQKPEVSEVASEVQQDTNLPPELPQASADITPPVTQADNRLEAVSAPSDDSSPAVVSDSGEHSLPNLLSTQEETSIDNALDGLLDDNFTKPSLEIDRTIESTGETAESVSDSEDMLIEALNSESESIVVPVTPSQTASSFVFEDENIDLIVEDLKIPDSDNPDLPNQSTDIVHAADENLVKADSVSDEVQSILSDDPIAESVNENPAPPTAVNVDTSSRTSENTQEPLIDEDQLIDIDALLNDDAETEVSNTPENLVEEDVTSENTDLVSEILLSEAQDVQDDMSAPIEEFVVDPAESLLVEDQVNEPVASTESDMDIVKALMADLTDDSFLEDGEIKALDTTALDVDDDSKAQATHTEEPQDLSHESDVHDDILAMTLEDETRLQQEQNVDSEETDHQTQEPEIDMAEASLLELADLANAEAQSAEKDLEMGLSPEPDTTSNQAQAQGEAQSADDVIDEFIEKIASDSRSEPSVSKSNDTAQPSAQEAILGTAAVATLGASALATAITNAEDQTDIDESIEAELQGLLTDVDNDDVQIHKETHEIEPQNIEAEEIENMPRTAKTDTILDDVTETATADVFASLNQAVEDRAIHAERGDRIGDLVMEALRPMLKEWLDANLKGIVERAVTKEVKRISSGK